MPKRRDDRDGPVAADGTFLLGRDLRDLVTNQAEWSRATFGGDAARGPVGALRHLAKEAAEAELAWVMYAGAGHGADTGAVREELADCLLLLLDASRRAGFTPLALVRAAADKMVVNKGRAWPRPATDEPVEHVRD